MSVALEASQKVTGRGGIGNTLGGQTGGVAGIVAQPVDVFQASAPVMTL